jgi:hypothetical protein
MDYRITDSGFDPLHPDLQTCIDMMKSMDMDHDQIIEQLLEELSITEDQAEAAYAANVINA